MRILNQAIGKHREGAIPIQLQGDLQRTLRLAAIDGKDPVRPNGGQLFTCIVILGIHRHIRRLLRDDFALPEQHFPQDLPRIG